MTDALPELSKLESLTAWPETPSKSKTQSIQRSLDTLLASLTDVRERCNSHDLPDELLLQLGQTIETSKKNIDDRQKEIYSSLSRYGKVLDKKFPTPLPSYPNIFTSPTSREALQRTIALHLLRTGNFDSAETFIEETRIEIPSDIRNQFTELHAILKALRNQNIEPALEWARNNRAFLTFRGSSLEFFLHRSQYIRLLLSTHPPNPLAAIAYLKSTITPSFPEHKAEICRLLGCIVFLPLSKLQTSPYKDLASPSLHFDLEPLFARDYCASLGMSRQVPLRVVGDIGGGGALSRIEKGRKLVRERRSEWSRTEELPIEIPLAPENRYHSIFACPVSKEQATPHNPPKMLSCGHVITADSLQKLAKSGGRVKCPYCPMESQTSTALQIYF